MNGSLLKSKIIEAGFDLAEVARLLSISPQNLQSKLNSKDIKVGFLKEIAKCINRSVYYLLDIEELDGGRDDIIVASNKPKEEYGARLNYKEKVEYLEVVIEAQRRDLKSKDMVISALQEA